MIEKTKGKYETNPHAQHEGALPCSECHKGHQKGVNYCGGCHNFVYNVP
jgi:fumarate reductase flavoprotein subunit